MPSFGVIGAFLFIHYNLYLVAFSLSQNWPFLWCVEVSSC